jgi:hypothetical protein
MKKIKQKIIKARKRKARSDIIKTFVLKRSKKKLQEWIGNQ